MCCCWEHAPRSARLDRATKHPLATLADVRVRVFFTKEFLIIDHLLASITPEQLRYVEAVLTNDEASSDEDLRKCFVEAELTEEQVRRALQYRNRYIGRLHLNGQTPIVLEPGAGGSGVSSGPGVSP